MFESEVQKERVGMPWGMIGACVAFVVLVALGYILIT